ncbi:MAG: hypothetical protein ABIA04_02370 [Pseudomonadota bacterium]
MGLIEFFGKRKEQKAQKQLHRYCNIVANKKLKNEDREIAIEELKKIGSKEAIFGLLHRYDFIYEKLIEDRQEKELVMSIVLSFKEKSIAPLKKYLKESSTVGWPVKILKELIPEEEVVSLLLEVLTTEEMSFQRDEMEKNIDVLNTLTEFNDIRIADKVLPFLDGDFDDQTKLSAIEIMGKLKAESGREKLLTLFVNKETPVRLKTEILAVLIKAGLPVTGFRKTIEEMLPSGYDITREGKIILRKTSTD